jgi:hypothetical protein
MENKKAREVQGLETIREQIMTFACGAHAFGVELDEYDPSTAWHAVFVVHFRDSNREERLFCRATKGDQHVRFWVEATLDEAAWRNHLDEILIEASKFDVAVSSIRSLKDEQKRLVRLSTRAWVPNFSQRIFGLTFSNLMDCKAALD